jgi:hypothetical protein
MVDRMGPKDRRRLRTFQFAGTIGLVATGWVVGIFWSARSPSGALFGLLALTAVGYVVFISACLMSRDPK